MIFFYRILTYFFFPVFVAIIFIRSYLKKEDKIRFKEKILINEPTLPDNKKIIWIHAASIGETNSVLPLITKLIKENQGILILLTSTTLSSSQLIEREKFNKNNFQHRFFLLDVQFYS